MDTKTATAELLKTLEDAVKDEGAAFSMYGYLGELFTSWYLDYPEGKRPIPETDMWYMREQVHHIQEAEALHKRKLTIFLDRIKALPDG